MLKINHVLTIFSLPGIQILIKITVKSGCEYFTLRESSDAKNPAGTPYGFAGQSNSNVYMYLRRNFDFLYFLFTIIFLSNDVITGISCKTVRISPIDYIYLGLTVRHQAHLQLSFFKNHIFWQAVNLCKLRTYTKHGPRSMDHSYGPSPTLFPLIVSSGFC